MDVIYKSVKYRSIYRIINNFEYREDLAKEIKQLEEVVGEQNNGNNQ